MSIEFKNIINPPEKVRMMYDAVIELMKNGNDVSGLTISSITATAGIGKGTAYEYFASKEDVITHALMYEYSIKIQALANATFKYSSFKDRVYSIMNWIDENKEYNQMFLHALKLSTDNEFISPDCDINSDNQVVGNILEYILGHINTLMDDGYKEGIITETDSANRAFVLISAMVEYGTLISLPPITQLAARSTDQHQAFVYKSLIARLNCTI